MKFILKWIRFYLFSSKLELKMKTKTKTKKTKKQNDIKEWNESKMEWRKERGKKTLKNELKPNISFFGIFVSSALGCPISEKTAPRLS